MNIFVLDRDPRAAARMLCDVHVNVMVREAAQMMSTAHHVLDGKGPPLAYRRTHVNHPCTIWARTSAENYRWLWEHADEIGREWTRRTGNVHKSHWVVLNLKEPPRNLPTGDLTPFAQAMPEKFKRPDAVLAYRLVYIFNKAYFARWSTPRRAPAWFVRGRKGLERSRAPAKNQSLMIA